MLFAHRPRTINHAAQIVRPKQASAVDYEMSTIIWDMPRPRINPIL